MVLLRRLGRLLAVVGGLAVLGTLGSLASVTLVPPSAGPAVAPSDGHATNLTARLTSLDHSSRIVNVQGVGCAANICSRVALRHTAATRSWLDGIASIRDITEIDALFLFKDGTERRLPIVADNRFLYIGRGYIGGKIAMDKLTSIEFISR
jgi:hypothetical protein